MTSRREASERSGNGPKAMNRETKIGLLVGLAFIIVIGVLLSDHIQSSTQPAAAVLTRAGEALDRSVASPGKNDPGAVAVTPPERVEPSVPVATGDQMSSPAGGAVILVSGGNQAQPGPVHVNPPARTASEVIVPPTDGVVTVPPGNTATIPSGPTPLAGIPESNPGAITTPDPRDLLNDALGAARARVSGAGASEGAVPAGGTTAAARMYKAVDGDSLYRITRRVYGTWTKAGQDAILRDNPQMGPKGDRVVVGMQYKIPVLAGGAVTPAAPQTATGPTAPVAPVTPGVTPPTGVTPGRTPTAAAPERASGFRIYKVKDGDSLWRIADRTGRSIAEIKLANRDVLGGSEHLKVGMQLKIPVSRAASDAPATAAAQ